MSDLTVELSGVRLANPVMPASGTFELDRLENLAFDPATLGAVVNKTVFLDARAGNPPPRIYETPCGMLNSIGIPSEGVESFLVRRLPLMRSLGPAVIVSLAEHSVSGFCKLAERVANTGLADMLELDLSCPNIEQGTHWATDADSLSEVVRSVTRAVPLPVIPKLSPSVVSIAEMAARAEDAGAAAVSMINTYPGVAIDIERKAPVLGNVYGGLSGPAIRPLAVGAVYATYQRVRIPIIGMGGIVSGEDAVQFLLAGATAVAVGMANFVNPAAMRDVITGIDDYLSRHGFQSVNDIIGLAHRT